MHEISSELKANPFSVKTPENLSATELFNLFVPYPEYENLQVSGHQFLNGHRGSGKSMMLRMMAPDCQCLALARDLMELPYFGVYLSIKTTEINLKEYARLEDETSGLILSEHVLATKLLSSLFISVKKHCEEQIKNRVGKEKLEAFIEKSLYKKLSYVGWKPQQVDSSLETNNAEATIDDLINKLIEIFDYLQAETARYVKQRAFSKEFIPYNGALIGFQDVVIPLIKELINYEIIPKQPVFFLLDDADNLSLQQTKILNTWVSYRSTDIASLKISTQMGYKTKRTSSGLLIETPHDYSEINFTSVYTGSVKESYPTLIRQIVAKRLAQIGLDDISPELFFPEDQKQLEAINKISDELKKSWAVTTNKGGYRASDDAYRYARPDYIRLLSGSSKQGARYRYAGFEQLIHISSGIIRFFLEPAARMYADQHKKNDGAPVTFISPDIQDDEIRKQSDNLAINRFDELKGDAIEDNDTPDEIKKIDQLRNVIQALGSLFQAHIMDNTLSQRRIFSFVISDTPPVELEEILHIGVKYGYLYEDTIGKKNGMGRDKLYVLTRRLAPAFKLDPIGFSNYLHVTSKFLMDVAIKPSSFITRLRKEGAAHALDAYQQASLFEDIEND